MACGEGYGSNLLAGAAASVIGVDANPAAHEHARARYREPNLRFERALIEAFAEPCDAIVFLQTIEHVRDAGAILDHFKSILGPGGTAYVSTPNLLTLAPPGAEKSDNPWHLHEYRAAEFRGLCEAHFTQVQVLGLFHARKLWAHERAIGLGWDAVHQRLGLTKRFYRALYPRDLDLRFRSRAKQTSTLPWTSSPSVMSEQGRGDLAIVLHSHMPYVEGFGTYPFGEEWLFDAVIRSYLPVLEIAERLTLTITPVLADQLEDEGTRERLREFLLEWRIGAAEADLAEVAPECRGACEAELARYRRALVLLEEAGSDPLRAFGQAAEQGRVALAASAATHAVLPLLATRAGLGLQLDAGIRSHRRRFGWGGGFWLPECAYVPGLEWRLAEHGVKWFCVDQSAHELPLQSLCPVATDAGPVALPIDWEAVSWLWSLDGYPSDPAYAQFAGKSLRGVRIWRVGGGAYDPAAAELVAARQAEDFLAAIGARLDRYRAQSGRRGLLVFAIDTELIGHWWSEGPLWLRRVIAGADAGRRAAAHGSPGPR